MNEEEEIIKNGLKSHSKVDTLCYAGMVLLAVLIFLPPICRALFMDGRPKSTIEDVVYSTLTCRYGYADENKTSVTKSIIGYYRNGEPRKAEVSFYYYADSVNEKDAEQAKYIALSDTVPEFKSSVNPNEIIYSIDFIGHKELLSKEELKEFTMPMAGAMTYYNNLEYICGVESETKQEDVAKWTD